MNSPERNRPSQTPSSRQIRLLVACALLSGWVLPGTATHAASKIEATAYAMTSAAKTLQESLPTDQREQASYKFADTERYDLRLAPFLLEGLEMADMSDPSQAKLTELLSASLGTTGLRKADEVRALEAEVKRQEAWYRTVAIGLFGEGGDKAYFLSLYGDPVHDQPWGYRFDGHHLSLNFTTLEGGVSPTPFFLGAEPRSIPQGGVGGPVGLRVLADEEDRARELYESLDDLQREKATLALQLDRGLFVGSGERVDPNLPRVGIAGADLGDAQKKRLMALLETYFGNVAPGLAAREKARLEAAGIDSVHFSWAGSTTPGAEMYYRVHGPTVLIEFDNTTGDGEHIHTLWRDPTRDFGRDLLRQHYESDQHEH
ncbi:MAG: DUF3500 domain-containing protein [Candidatus Binatia bacterium]|nr:DUF3500 domain-containing protein [Candidatus Binatia bacterium]